MKNKQKQRKQRKQTNIIMALAMLIFTVFITFMAYAKYSASLSETPDGVQVAKWSFKVNGSANGANTFNLVNTINENSSVEKGKVAPGTDGYFGIRIDPRGSDVAINYIVSAQIDEHPKNMHFYLDEEHLIELPVEDGAITINDFIPISELDREKDVSIYWAWPFETGNTEEERYKNNLEDTKSMGKTINVDITVIGIQTLPDAPNANYNVYLYLENANDENYTLYSQTTRILSGKVDAELTLANVADEIIKDMEGDIKYSKYAFGKTDLNGEKVSNVKIDEEGRTNIYLYFDRDRYTLTTKADQNVAQINSTGLSTGTSNDYRHENGEFIQDKKTMVTHYKWGETVTLTASTENIPGYTNVFSNWTLSPVQVEGENVIPNLGTNYSQVQNPTSIVMPRANIEITANAEQVANNYTVIFNENTGSGTMQSQGFVYDVEQALTANTYTKTGYNFKCWNTKPDGQGTSYNNEEPVKNLVAEQNGTITLYAIWQPNEYIVVFNSNGGNGEMLNQTFKYDEQQNLNSNQYTKPGYTFVNWNTEEDGSGTIYNNGEGIINLTSRTRFRRYTKCRNNTIRTMESKCLYCRI